MSGALEELARSADEAARDHQRIARRARQLDQARRRGLPWSAVLDGDERPGLVELLARSAKHVAEMTNQFRRLLIDALVKEGLSTREIGRRLNVSHQRVSAVVRRGSP